MLGRLLTLAYPFLGVFYTDIRINGRGSFHIASFFKSLYRLSLQLPLIGLESKKSEG
jgi:hypothetical protein